MIFLRFNGKSCDEGVDMRSLDVAIAAIREAYPGKAIRDINQWVVLQWEPRAGAGRIEIQGHPAIEVAARAPLADDRRSQPFFLPVPSAVKLVPIDPLYEPVQIFIDGSGHLTTKMLGPAVPTPR